MAHSSKEYMRKYMRNYRRRRKERTRQLWNTLFFLINTQTSIIQRMDLPTDAEDFTAILRDMQTMVQRLKELTY